MVKTDDLSEKMDEQARRTLAYGRNRFLWTWLCMALLALLIGVALEISAKTAKNQNETVKVTADTANGKADANKKTNDEITKYLKGEQGIAGVPGANGKDGAPGQPGSIPSDLPPGPAGPAGPRGPKGTSGPSGVPGNTGPAGESGQTGNTGAVGPTGAQGESGLVGPKGDTGLQGPEGISGPQGPVGPVGPTGPAGTSAKFSPQFIGGTSNNDDLSPKSIVVACPSGTKAIGGGFNVPSGIEVIQSQSVVDGWSVVAVATTIAPGKLWTLHGSVVCA